MHIKKIGLMTVTLALLFSGTSVSAQTANECALLSKNLRLGMSGADVKVLQQILNKNVATRIATSGVGAPGFETTYFGAKTKVAVIKFQQLYANEVLTPSGLSVGSGFVGSFSRTKLKALCSGSPVTVSPATPSTTTLRPGTAPSVTPAVVSPVKPIYPVKPVVTQGSQRSFVIPAPVSASTFGTLATPASDTGPLTLTFPSDYTVSPGDKLTVYGQGLSKTANIVHVGTLALSAVVDSSGGLTVTIPTNAQFGKFDLYITNANGTSNKTFLIIRAKGGVIPKIVNYTPRSGLLGTTVTVTGEGFTTQGNDIYLGNQIIAGVRSADSKTLSFVVDAKDVPGASTGLDVPNMDVTIPVWFYIINENGISGSAIFTIKI